MDSLLMAALLAALSIGIWLGWRLSAADRLINDLLDGLDRDEAVNIEAELRAEGTER